MKTLILAIFVCSSIITFAKGKDLNQPYNEVYDSLDLSISPDSAMFLFDLSKLDADIRQDLLYAVDGGKNQIYDYSDGDTLTIVTTPGTHSFEFYAGPDYAESPLMQLNIEKQHRKMYVLSLYRVYKEEMLHVRKPVMYFYPEKETTVEVKVNPTGKLTYTYPPIEDGWKFNCSPSGLITKDDASYRYLFWESEQPQMAALINKKKGKVLKGSEAVSYLDQAMRDFGMTGEERADFITYWGPILQTKSNLYIYLLFNEDCNAFASLKISPEPDQTARFYVLWTELPENYSPTLEPQEIPATNREGFTVLEWGGAEFDCNLLLNSDL